MRNLFLFWIGVLFVAMTGGGGCNLFNEMSDKTSDAVIYDDAVNLIDKGDWGAAIAKIGLMSPTGQAQEATKVLLATAYAGRGGLDVINIASSMGNMGAQTFFQFLISAFKGASISQFNDEVTAEGIMQSISVTAAGRTTDENIFMIFLEFAKLGTLMAATGDLNGDGLADGTYNPCALTVAQGAHVITAIGNILDAFAVTGTTIGGQPIGTVNNLCAAIGGGACNVLQVGSVTGLENQIGRTLVGETNAGIGLAIPALAGNCEVDCPGGPGVAPCAGACPGQTIPNLCP